MARRAATNRTSNDKFEVDRRNNILVCVIVLHRHAAGQVACPFPKTASQSSLEKIKNIVSAIDLKVIILGCRLGEPHVLSRRRFECQ
jgi:hypothetical protein